MPGKAEPQSWKNATWKGSRGVQLRTALAMTMRERFQALEELAALAQRLASMPRVVPHKRGKNAAAR